MIKKAGSSQLYLTSNTTFKKKIKQVNQANYYTGYGGTKGHKGNGVDAVLQVNEAAKMASHITDDSCATTDGTDGDHKCRVSVIDS